MNKVYFTEFVSSSNWVIHQLLNCFMLCRSERCVGLYVLFIRNNNKNWPQVLSLTSLGANDKSVFNVFKLFEKSLFHWVCSFIQLIDSSAIKLFYVARCLMGFTYLFMFVSVEELNSPACPDDFQDVEVKDEPFEYDAVSCDFS